MKLVAVINKPPGDEIFEILEIIFHYTTLPNTNGETFINIETIKKFAGERNIDRFLETIVDSLASLRHTNIRDGKYRCIYWIFSRVRIDKNHGITVTPTPWALENKHLLKDLLKEGA